VTTPVAELVEFRRDGVRLVADRYTPSGLSAGLVLFLHGGGQTRHSWGGTARRLAERGWTAITLDAGGHGVSDWSPDGDYGMDAIVADLRFVVRSCGELPVLVGASMGGVTSMVAQGEHGDVARAMVLVDITPRIEPEGVRRITDFMRGRPEGFESLEEVAEAIRAYNPHRTRPVNVAGLHKNVRQREDGRWYWHWDPAFLRLPDEPSRLTRFDRLLDAARNIRVPTLLIRGMQSDIVSEEGARELLELIPGSEYVDVAGAGHMVAGDDNDVFSASLLDFLERHPVVGS
jgi:pimeloyl-ACP methyl ester carboxylesterase